MSATRRHYDDSSADDEYTELIRDITEEPDQYDNDDDRHFSRHRSDSSSDMEPIDRLSLVKITFALIGLSQLLPWNFLITANDYWNYKFRDINGTIDDTIESTSSAPVTSLQKYFESYVSIATNVPFLAVLAFNALFGHKISDNFKNLWAFITIIVIFIITTIFVKINTDFYQQTFFGLTIASIVFLSTSAGILQSSVSGIAALFPAHCMQAMVTGQAVSGLFAAAAQVLALMGHWYVTNTAFYYFLMADITLVLSLIMYLYAKQTDFYRYHKQRVKQSRRELQSFELSAEQNSIKSIGYSIWPHLVSAALIFWVTLSVFPAITVLVGPQRPDTSYWTGKYFIPITCFLLFNVSDLMGRFAGQFAPIPALNKRALLLLAMGRVVFIPAIMLCNAGPRQHLPVLFPNETYFILFITLLGFTNGYVLINVMINGPTLVGYQCRERAGFLLVCFLGVGLTLGSFSSTLLVRLL